MMRSFLTALAIPATVGAAAALAIVFAADAAPLVALLVNVFLLCEVGGLAQVVAIPLPRAYFRPRRIERRGLYEALGVRQFKRLMVSRAYRAVNPEFRLSGGRRGLDALASLMESAEAAHALLFVIVSALAAAAWLAAWRDTAVWLMVFNVALNGYPVLLQRYNRLRLQRVMS